MVRGSKPREGDEFSAPFQAGSGAHPASYTTSSGSFPGVKRPGHGVNHPPPSNANVKDRVELNFHSPSVPSWQVIGPTLSLSISDNSKVSRWPLLALFIIIGTSFIMLHIYISYNNFGVFRRLIHSTSPLNCVYNAMLTAHWWCIS